MAYGCPVLLTLHGTSIPVRDSADAYKHKPADDPNAADFYESAGARLIGERPSDSIEGRMLPLYEIDNPDEVSHG